MAFMMPVMKNDWDIYNSRRGGSGGGGGDSTEKGRVRKVSESRSEGPALGVRSATLSPHRSAPAMRSLSYCRTPASRASLRAETTAAARAHGPTAASRNQHQDDKFHTRLVEKLKRALGRSESKREERTSARAESPERGSRCIACVPYL